MRARSLLVFALVAGPAACSLITDLSPLGGGDASDVSVLPEAPADGFTLAVTPLHVTQDPGDSVDLAVSIQRGATFSDIVDVTVNDVGGLSGLLTSPASLAFTGTAPVNLHLDVASTAKTPQDGAITLLGVGRTTQKSFSTKFAVRIGSVLLDTTTSTTFTPPPYAKLVTIKAWGAGGAAGYTSTDGNSNMGPGGTGGGGGMSGAIFDVSNLGPLAITVGTTGTTTTLRAAGSGGGYTSVAAGATTLLVAGGGGGGGSGGLTSDAYCTAYGGGNATAGGGGNAQSGKTSATMIDGGPGGGGAATAGGPLQGGDGAGSPCNNCKWSDGGVPGGGRGATVGNCVGSAGGGGGGGWFGGGGGGLTTASFSPGVVNGGGGGSGYVSDAGTDAIHLAGNGTIPGGVNDPDYAGGTASGGVAADPSNAAVPPTPGRVVVRASKP